jgi:hypothetical protein
MSVDELAGGVIRLGLAALAVGAVAAVAVGGPRLALGVVGGGLIALMDFRWLARDAARLTTPWPGERPPRLLPIGLRHLAALSGLTLLIAGGWTHPLAVIAGLGVLPPVLIAQGLRSARV